MLFGVSRTNMGDLKLIENVRWAFQNNSRQFFPNLR